MYSTTSHLPKLRYGKTCSHTGYSENEIVVIDDNAMEGRRIKIPTTVQDKTLKQQHLNHMGIENIRLLATESIYWINMNADIEEMVEYCITCLDV